VETFDYTAIDKLGKRLSGSISASNARDARDQLRGRALTLTELKAAKQKKPSRLTYERTISHKDLTQASRQLAILIDAATPIEESLKVVALQFEKSPMRRFRSRSKNTAQDTRRHNLPHGTVCCCLGGRRNFNGTCCTQSRGAI